MDDKEKLINARDFFKRQIELNDRAKKIEEGSPINIGNVKFINQGLRQGINDSYEFVVGYLDALIKNDMESIEGIKTMFNGMENLQDKVGSIFNSKNVN